MARTTIKGLPAVIYIGRGGDSSNIDFHASADLSKFDHGVLIGTYDRRDVGLLHVEHLLTSSRKRRGGRRRKAGRPRKSRTPITAKTSNGKARHAKLRAEK